MPHKRLLDLPTVLGGVISTSGIFASIKENLPTIVLVVSLVLGLLNISYLLYKWMSNWKGFRPWKKK